MMTLTRGGSSELIRDLGFDLEKKRGLPERFPGYNPAVQVTAFAGKA
jgi:hypothetical protein